MPPRQFDFNEVHQFIKETRQKPIANVTPIARTDIARMSSKGMSVSNPPIVNVIFGII
jgi:hypothetical protein